MTSARIVESDEPAHDLSPPTPFDELSVEPGEAGAWSNARFR
jgi:hypothetical protein